jgi:dolichol-phosphate mannosyltransferase
VTSVTVIVPAYNEGSMFAASLVSIAEYFSMHRAAGYDFRYLIVDDGSRDDTWSAAMGFARWRKDVRVLRHETNRGLGAALRTAFQEVDSELAVVLDADLSYSPATAMRLIETLEHERADIALASPYMHGGLVVNVPPMRRMLSQEANRLLSLATSGRYATLTCMVRAYRVSALRRLQFHNDRMEAVAEMLFSALRQKMLVVEVPATLQWTDERRGHMRRMKFSTLISRVLTTVMIACRYRPALWLALPGLFPGLLPLAVVILLLFHVSGRALAIGTAAIIVVQYASLALFSGQLATFFGRRLRLRAKHQGANTNAHRVSSRIA